VGELSASLQAVVARALYGDAPPAAGGWVRVGDRLQQGMAVQCAVGYRQ